MAKRRRDRVRPTPAGDDAGAKIVAEARAILGEGWTYCSPSDLGRRCVDCSGFTRLAVQRATGLELSPDSHEQMNAGQLVPAGEEQDGDLAFYDTAQGNEVRGGNAASHVGIWAAGGNLLGALNPSLGIRESDLSSDYWQGKTGDRVRYLGARRLVAAEVDTQPPETSKPPREKEPDVQSAAIPVGPIKTPAPGGSFNTDWSAITRWWPQIAAAAAETAAPADRLAAHIVIESRGQPDAIQKNDTNGWSYGLLQVVPRWWRAVVSTLAGRTFATDDEAGRALIADPALAIRAGATVIRSFRDQNGSWDAASSGFFTGTPNWNGQDTVNGTTGNAYKRALDGLMAEIAAAAQAIPPPSTSVPVPDPPKPDRAPTLGRVPPPEGFAVRLIQNNSAWDDLGARIPRGIVLHRMLGTLLGTDGYFRGEAAGRALTDFGVGIGRVYQWNDLRGRRAPWASGPADGVDGDGTAFFARYGINAINRDCASVEIEGNYEMPLPVADKQRLIELVAWLADSWLGVTWEQWPRNRDGIHALLGHSEFTNSKICPGPVVYAFVPELIESVRARLRQFQVGAADDTGSSTPPVKRFPVDIPDEVVLAMFAEANPDVAKGPVTAAWLAACKRDNRWYVFERKVDGDDGWAYWIFGGAVIRAKGGRVEEVEA